jgi:C4-dicarboxylate transporter DctM subunit
VDIAITFALILALFALLGSGIWIGLALLGVGWMGMELFTPARRG